MSFHNTQLDPDISYGAVGGPTYGTTIQTTASGHEYRIARQAQARRKYQFAKELMEPAEWGQLLEFWHARRGHLHGFRMKDWADYSSAADGVGAHAATDQVIGTGDGTTTQFQLLKIYDFGGINPYTEAITLPVAGTVLAKVGATITTAFTISNPGGVITFATAPANGLTITAGYQYDRAVRFDTSNEWYSQRLTQGYLGSWQTIECIELLGEVELPELWYPGGVRKQDASQDVVLTYDYEMWDLRVQTGGGGPTITAWLPAPDRVPGGPRIFTIFCTTGSTNSVVVKDDAGNTVVTITAGNAKRIALSRAGSNYVWLAY